MVVADHFLWFFYFAEKAQEAKRYNSSSRRFRQAASAGGKAGPTFMDVAAFFAVCVWFVPLFLFLSLSANDNVLPRMGTFRSLSGVVKFYSPSYQIKHRVHHPASALPST